MSEILEEFQVIHGLLEKIAETDGFLEFEWKIPNFLCRTQQYEYRVESPKFEFLGAECILCAEYDIRHGVNFNIDIICKLKDGCSYLDTKASIGIKSSDGTVYKSVSGPLVVPPAIGDVTPRLLLSQSNLMRHKTEIIPQGILTISCCLGVKQEYCKRTTADSATQTVISEDFDWLALLSFRSTADASTETVQEDVLEAAAAQSDNTIIPADLHFQAALAFCSKTDASTETVQEDFIETATGESDESDDAIIPAGTWQTRISQLYDTKENANVRFVVKGRIFEAHRFVLAMRSPEFSRILISVNAAVYTHIIEAESVTEAAFDILLRFLYTDTLGTTDKQSIIEAYLCALAYKVSDLQDKCNEAMKTWNITTEEIFTLLDIGLDVPTLKDKCMHLLRTEGQEALSSPAFLEISSRCLRFILESSVLEKVPLLERIKRVIEWCIHPHTEGADYAGARKKLLDDSSAPLLGRLEFENLELNELTLVLSIYQGLITPQELMCFLNYKHTQDASVLPAWCLSRVSSKGAS